VLLKGLGTTLDGLSHAEVLRRRSEFGFNEVAHEQPPRWYVQFLKAFGNPFIALLAPLGVVTFLTDDPNTTTIIAVMVLMSVLLRFVQEYRSTSAADRPRAMVRNTATVTRRMVRGPRDGPRTLEALRILGRHGRVEVPLRELVPGDIVHLSAGDMVPADLRLVLSEDLFVSQAALTGESMPVEKSELPVPHRGTSGRDRSPERPSPLGMSNLCFMGSSVISGTATGVVLATGQNTYFGSMARTQVGRRVLTSFDCGVNGASWPLIRFTLAMVPVVFLLNILTKGDRVSAFVFSVAVAVGLTPEMLPMIESANRARGAVAMSRRKVIVKRLCAIQDLGAMDIPCTDKSGLLTQGRVILERHLDVLGGESRDPGASAARAHRRQPG
jgi:Mg2+-importing ATPase